VGVAKFFLDQSKGKLFLGSIDKYVMRVRVGVENFFLDQSIGQTFFGSIDRCWAVYGR